MSRKKKETPEKESPVANKHTKDLEAIADRVAEEHLRESGLEVKDENEDEIKEAEAEAAKETTGQEDEAPGPEKEIEPEPEKPEFVKLKVYGEEIVKPKTEVDEHGGVAAYQMELAAERRLREASEIKKSVETMRAELQTLIKAMTEDEPEPEVKKPEPKAEPKSDLKELRTAMNKALKDYEYSLQYQEEEDQSSAREAYLNAQEAYYDAKGAPQHEQQATLNEDAVVEKTWTKIRKKEIFDKFTMEAPERGGYKDLWDDLRARQLVQAEANKLIHEDKRSDLDWNTYKEAGDTIRKYLGWDLKIKDAAHRVTVENPPAATAPIPTVEANPENFKGRVEVKRKIDNIESVNAKTESQAKEEKPETPREVIAQMRASRPGSRV